MRKSCKLAREYYAKQPAFAGKNASNLQAKTLKLQRKIPANAVKNTCKHRQKHPHDRS